MALNPPVSQAGIPLRVEGEMFVLHRKDMECEVKITGMGKYSAKGKVYLTTARITFVNDHFVKDQFKAFDIPLAFMFNEKFEQPIFGSNYLQGDVKPLHGLLPGNTHFKLWFKSGGCSMFLKMLVEILKQIRQRRQQGIIGPDPRFIQQVTSNQSQAFMDPNDPSVIYVSQPNDQFSQCNNYVGNNIYQQGQPVNNYPPPNQYQQPPPPNQYQQPPPNQYQQPPPNQYQQPPPNQYQQPPPNQYPPPPNQYPPPPNQYPPPPEYQQNPNNQQASSQYQYPSENQYQQTNQQPPPNYQQQNQFQGQGVPIGSNEQQQQQQQQQPQQQQQQQQQQPQQQPNIGYYYGFWGPRLESNQQNNQQL